MSIGPSAKAAIAATRFGLGARPGEIELARRDPVGFLKAQIRPEGAEQPQGALPPSDQAFVALRQAQMMQRQDKAASLSPPKPALADVRQGAQQEFLARARLACSTDAGFRERWTLFWCNHFTIGAKNDDTLVLAGPFEREAIRPYVFGRFEDLLVASSRHPAMLIYLDQFQSIGPNSPAAVKRGAADPSKRGGLNENLGREIMELHTLGVGSGYTQADVTEFARALTGWSIQGLPPPPAPPTPFSAAPPSPPPMPPGQFIFRQNVHEPGPRHILGKPYAQDGEAQARAVLHDLAAHPATARHLALKLARHFVADDPPPTLVAGLQKAYLQSDGRLDQLAAALIDAPEAWAPPQRKFKTPYEFMVSSYRALNREPVDYKLFGPELASLGQAPFAAPSPKGWAEDAQTWAAPDAVIKRMDWAEAFAAAAAPVMDQPVQVAQQTLGAQLSPAVNLAVSRAETRPEAFSILLMSPEFQRR
ncbi:MAG: DUF1800 family protein [Caulobacteraceae bacterium]|nr:DUF1800 family protein [Caulobacteraceae bacterium]